MKTIYEVMLGLFLFAIGITDIKSQEFNLTTYDSEFYIGFYKHFDIGQPQFYIHTFKTTPVRFNVTSLDGIFSYTGTCTHLNPAIVDIPVSYEVNGYDYSWRRKGLRISSLKTEPISVIYRSHRLFGDYMAYLAYPCHKQPTSEYVYYAVSSMGFANDQRSQFLIVGCSDNTSVTIIPTGNITLPIDAQDMANTTITLTAGQNHSLVLHSMQTLLIFASNSDLTASKIISNQPLTILSGHQAALVPIDSISSNNDPIITQVTPTIVWGKQFLLSLHSDKGGQSYRIIASMDNTVIVRKCGSDAIVNDTLYADQWLEFFTIGNIYCSVVSNNPIYVAQLGVSYDYNGRFFGDPSINTVAPMEQYINSIQYTTLTADSHYYSVVMPNDEYYDGTLIFDGSLQIISEWNAIYYSDGSIAGYGYSSLTTGTHTITHPNEQGKLFVSVYGWSSFRGYSYAGGMSFNPIFIDCGNPDDPDPNGDVSYIATTFGNTANYSCDYGYLLDVSQGGPVVVTCLASGVWSDTAPACSPVDCGNPDDPDPNGDVSYVATTFGNTANYSCDYGYLLDVSQGGSVVVTCLASGVWSDTAPACALLGLVSPPVINNNEIGSTTAIIRWDPPIDPNGEITSYTVEAIPIQFKEDPYDTDRAKRQTEETFLTCTEFLNISVMISITVGGNSLNVTLTGLIPFTVYEIRVAASTVIGRGNFSNVTSFATAVDDPAPILELEGVARDLTSIVLSWEGPACPNGIITGYYIYYRISNTIQPQPIDNSGYTKDRLISSERDVVYSITDLSPGQYYAIHVRAFTIDDNDSELIGMVDTEILVMVNDSRVNFESRPNTGVDDTSIGLPSLSVLSDVGIENITYYGVIVVPDPDMDFNPNVDDFNSTYPNVQPYESRGDNRYYIAAAWNDVSEVPNRFTAGDESRTMAMRSEINETYFNAKLDRFTPHCYYVIIHHILSIGDEVVIRYYELTCRDTRLGYNIIALIVCLILAFLILCGLFAFIIICCCCWCHHRSKSPVSEKKEVLSQLKEPREEAKYEYEMSSVSIAFRGLEKESKTLGFRQGEEETST